MWYITAHKAIMLAGLRDAITSRSQLAALEPLAQSRLSISRSPIFMLNHMMASTQRCREEEAKIQADL